MGEVLCELLRSNYFFESSTKFILLSAGKDLAHNIPNSRSRDLVGQPLYSYDEIVSVYPFRWSRDLGGSRDLVNKLHVYWLSNYSGQLFMRGL